MKVVRETPGVTVYEYENRIADLDLAATEGVDKAYGGLPLDTYYALGMAEEAGEAAGKVKKFYRDGRTPEKVMALLLELGDTLWYLTRQANGLGYSLYDIMYLNLEKLDSRQARGTQRGDGDNR